MCVRIVFLTGSSVPPDKNNVYTYNELYQSAIFLGKCRRKFQCLLLTFPKVKHRLNTSRTERLLWVKSVLYCVLAPEPQSSFGACSSRSVSACCRTEVPASSVGALAVSPMNLGDLWIFSLLRAKNCDKILRGCVGSWYGRTGSFVSITISGKVIIKMRV